jgi:hypothetical protein
MNIYMIVIGNGGCMLTISYFYRLKINQNNKT